MDKKEYNACVSRALKGQHFSPGERKREFCIAAKVCSSKASSREEADQMCEITASQPKAAKASRQRKAPAAAGGVRLVLLTTTTCPSCSSAKQYLQDKIDKGLVEVLNIQKSDEAAAIAAKYKILSVPKLMVIDDEGIPFSEIQITDTEQLI